MSGDVLSEPTLQARWRVRFDPRPTAWAAALLLVLVLLATEGAHLGWIRGFAGDSLAVIFVYCVLRCVIECPVAPLAMAAFGLGALIESGQYLAMRYEVRIANRMLRIVLGSTPDWWDVLAYAIGAALAIVTAHGRRGR